jgi:putative restriction endonuclease
MNASLEQYSIALTRLHVNHSAGHISPHKPVMLLAVLSLADNGGMTENRIEYGTELLELFREYFIIVASSNDRCTPLLPFFHLRSDRFWHHVPHAGQEQACRLMSGPGSAVQMTSVIEYARLDDELFLLLVDRTTREVLRQAIIDRYFPNCREALLKLSQQEVDIGAYRELFDSETPKERVKEPSWDSFDEQTRQAGFRRSVTQAYDYSCAACGLRVILGEVVMVDAAHLIPFGESHDDDPRNGMALCKNHHWAMDRLLIGPWPDGRWHVHHGLDDRREGQQDLLKLDGRDILLPRKSKYHPRKDALQWRMDKMKECA